jgi:hypothetical protein
MSAVLITYVIILCAAGFVPGAIFYIRHYNRTPRAENRIPLSLYIVLLLTCAFVAAWVGVGLGAEYACSSPSPGNLCGLRGFFVVGPLSSIITVTVVSWLMTYFPLQMKRIAPIGLILILLAVGFHYRDHLSSFFLHNVMHQSDLIRYRLQSDNVDDLHRYASEIEVQMRELNVLEDVSLDSQVKSDQATLGIDPKKRVPIIKLLPTMTITFRLAPKVVFGDAIAQIHGMETRLTLPASILTSFASAK